MNMCFADKLGRDKKTVLAAPLLFCPYGEGHIAKQRYIILLTVDLRRYIFSKTQLNRDLKAIVRSGKKGFSV